MLSSSGVGFSSAGGVRRGARLFHRGCPVWPPDSTPAAAFALGSRHVEAAEACAAGLRLDPTFSVAKFRDLAPSNNAVFLAQRERVYDGMRKAGVPEG